ncbi:biotin/lipoyl-containing protein [Clostridium thermarum]|uniref:biotin/lipoyl-containing protein n=1 Tax=Clostridium thermarum TaxID=1716543 RepID=UPI0013D0900D|nr:biotin/lipoyl-containing protein [Clostridium thermarum]
MKKYYVTVNGKKYAVEVEEVQGDLVIPATNTVPVYTEGPLEEKVITQQPKKEETPKEVEETKKNEPEPSQAQATDGEKIECPMPGTIVRVDVSVGSTVKKGEVLMVLEAMKMENEIMAPRDCKVVSINVTKGTSVDTGDVLLVIQ